MFTLRSAFTESILIRFLLELNNIPVWNFWIIDKNLFAICIV